MASPLVSPSTSLYVVLIKLPLKQPVENLPCIFAKPLFQVFYDRPDEMTKALRKKSIALFRFEKSVLSSNHFFHSRLSYLNGSSWKFRDYIFSSPCRIQDLSHYLMWQGNTGGWEVPYSKWNLWFNTHTHKLLQMITCGLQYLLRGIRAGTNIEGWVTVIPTWKVLSPLVPLMGATNIGMAF